MIPVCKLMYGTLIYCMSHLPVQTVECANIRTIKICADSERSDMACLHETALEASYYGIKPSQVVLMLNQTCGIPEASK